ncbi:hypothetical protein [Pelomonas cellulosilytica]|uniref:Uncharacterized protein n=1 Tax=Pelomonas cellulosilytica TaxID=2906762 RepID=A0ABS8XZG8_9BURK|nr:hypothetical protein [Pelomonas sp. P8]MCE4558011.1 hypothetical protein [Pelomonas sp. P8]
MFVLILRRERRPDAPYWPGRRLLAAMDAVAWPLACAVLALQIPKAAGLAFLVTVVAALCAFFRLCGAILNNQRYWFTSWRVLRLCAFLLFVGLVTKLAMWAAPAIR